MSLEALGSCGLRLPHRMASASADSVMPHPSSVTEKNDDSPSHSARTQMFREDAAIELSMISATAVDKL